MSDEIWLAVIGKMDSWMVSLAALIGALVAAGTSVVTMLRSGKTNKAVAAQDIVVKETVQTLTTRANETQAIAAHAQKEMVDTREEARKLYQFVETDVFMAKASQPTDSGRPGLSPVTDFGDLHLEDKT
jgi:hypothetical protein